MREADIAERENWARHHVPLAAALVTLFCVLDIVLGPFPPSPRPVPLHTDMATRPGLPPRPLTPLEIARRGNEEAVAFLGSLNKGGALRTYERARAAVVRIYAAEKSVKKRESDDERRTLHGFGSGVLVDGGRRLLTAGHVLDMLKEHPDAVVSVVMADGRERKCGLPAARGGIDGAPEGDWGLVELTDTPPEGCPSLPMRAAVKDSTVILLGYSSILGVDTKGMVWHAIEFCPAPLFPFAAVGTVRDPDLEGITITAGAETQGGASGGAIVDLEGNLVGIMVGGLRSRSGPGWSKTYTEGQESTAPIEFTPMEDKFSVGGTPVGVFRAFVEARSKR